MRFGQFSRFMPSKEQPTPLPPQEFPSRPSISPVRYAENGIGDLEIAFPE